MIFFLLSLLAIYLIKAGHAYLKNKVPTQEFRSFLKSIHAWSQK